MPLVLPNVELESSGEIIYIYKHLLTPLNTSSMKKKLTVLFIVCSSSVLMFLRCSERATTQETTSTDSVKTHDFGGFESQVKWGEHLTRIAGCNDCHTPKKMTDHGPEIDWDLMLSGHPANGSDPDVNRKDMEAKGLAVTGDLTSWVGPWGVSYTANLTPDSTGTLSWTEEQFMYAIRNGIYKGLPGGRPMLPPMPWSEYKNMTDGELKAIFAFLKSIKPISNVVPPPKPPVSAPPGKK